MGEPWSCKPAMRVRFSPSPPSLLESPTWSWRRSEKPIMSVRFAPPAPTVADAEAGEAAGCDPVQVSSSLTGHPILPRRARDPSGDPASGRRVHRLVTRPITPLSTALPRFSKSWPRRSIGKDRSLRTIRLEFESSRGYHSRAIVQLQRTQLSES